MNFWLQGKEDPNPTKKEQYARWRGMRDAQKKNRPGPVSSQEWESLISRKKLPAVLPAVGVAYGDFQQLAAPGGTSKLLQTLFI